MAFHTIETEVKRKLKRIDLENTAYRVYQCPVCGNGKVYIENAVFYGKCNSCDATLFDFEPLPHQMDYFLSNATFKLLLGGFGSGKTTVACFEDAYHALTIPNARIVITAPTLQQMKAAILPELNKFLPPWLLIGGKSKGNPPIYRLYNGSEIYVYASDDEQKLRSLNLTRFHIEEGSGVPKEVFTQLTTRLRNNAAVVYDKYGVEVGNRFSGVISTNPEDAWIKDDFLLKSTKLHGSESIDITRYEHLMAEEREPLFESFISASFDNILLPKGTIERISAGKSEQWKRKYLWSYLDTREGLVYTDIYKHFVEPFEIPKHWKRIGGYDPGISDPTATLIGAIDPRNNIIYFYDEYYVRDQTISYHGNNLTDKIKPYSWYKPLSADPSVRKRSQQSGLSYAAYFRQVTGITLNPVNNDLLYGIDKVRDYLYQGKIKFFNNLVEFKREAGLYSFPSPEDKNYRNTNNKPIDKDNHLMDCLRYAIVPLPENPTAFKAVYIQDEVLNNTHVYSDKTKGIHSPNSGYQNIVYGWRK